MAITIDLPPQMTKEASGYAMLEGTSLEEYVFGLVKSELQRKREAHSAIAAFDALVKKTGRRLKGEPYKFNRADAYPEGEYA